MIAKTLVSFTALVLLLLSVLVSPFFIGWWAVPISHVYIAGILGVLWSRLIDIENPGR